MISQNQPAASTTVPAPLPGAPLARDGGRPVPPLRVGLAIETDSPGGAETMLLQLARELLSLGHHVVAFGPTGGEGWLTARLTELGVERELIEFEGPFGLGSVPEIAGRIRRHRLDVLHSHEFEWAVCGALGARLAGVPHVITMHGGTYYAGRPRRRWALRLASKLSRRTVAVSAAVRGALAETLRISGDAVDVVHNGVAPRAADPGSVREELGLASEDALVLAVGNLLPVKGHAVLLRALAHLAGEGRRVVAAIAGRGPEEGPLRALAAELGIERDVALLGYRPDVAALMAGADVFAMPSLSEGLPMAVIEAMLAGKAIVASNVGGMAELLPTPELGRLVPAADPEALAASLSELLADGPLRERLGRAARTRALQEFTAAAMAQRYVELYRG